MEITRDRQYDCSYDRKERKRKEVKVVGSKLDEDIEGNSNGIKVISAGERKGRKLVEIEYPNGWIQLFYSSMSGTSGKEQGTWYPIPGFLNPTGWFIKDSGIKQFYNSEVFSGTSKFLKEYMENMEQVKNKIGTIKLTDFSLRHFDREFGGTKILNLEPQDFESYLNQFKEIYYNKPEDRKDGDFIRVDILDGYAPFCKLLVMKNITDAKTGTLPITVANHQYLRSGYSSRREGEFAVFSRWFDLPVSAPKAEYTITVLYNKEQLDKEAKSEYDKAMARGGVDSIGLEPPTPFDADWGAVAILGQMTSKEEPMKPITMLRNYMDISMGGSGMKAPTPPTKPNIKNREYENLEKTEQSLFNSDMDNYNEALAKYNEEMKEINDKYDRSVKFWNENATVK